MYNLMNATTMKKEYIIPKMIVVNVEIQNLMEASQLTAGGTATKGGEVLSRDGGNFWDDDDDY
jgi:hypothetical protein